MKSFLLAATLISISLSLFAQSLSVKMNSRQPASIARVVSPEGLLSVTDTADIYILRATGGTFYGAQGGGYVFGTSYLYDTSTAAYYPVTDETGIEFDGIGNATVTDLLFWAGAKTITGSTDDITGKVYNVGTDSMPTTLVGSGTMNMADVDTSLAAPAFTDLVISGGANVTAAFFVSIDYAGIDDTIGFVSTGAGDGNMEKRIRQKASPDFLGAWGRMGDLYPFLDVDLFWAPVYTTTGTGVDNHFTLSGATLEAVYPTLASSEIHLDYTLKENSTVGYCMFDLRGKKYFELKSEQQHAGSYSQTFDVSNLAGGNYFLGVSINGSHITQKVVVAK
jgi:hypothetical protein